MARYSLKRKLCASAPLRFFIIKVSAFKIKESLNSYFLPAKIE